MRSSHRAGFVCIGVAWLIAVASVGARSPATPTADPEAGNSALMPTFAHLSAAGRSDTRASSTTDDVAAQGRAGTTTVVKPVDWVALNPAFAGATFVNDPETCAQCHGDYVERYRGTTHGRLFERAPPAGTGDCESCHGPRSGHLEDFTVSLTIDPDSASASAVCLQCHDSGPRLGWKAGAHQSADVSCSSCHVIMEQKSVRALLPEPTVTGTCYQCHGEVRAEASKTSHHPIREGRMDCASCHNPHGSTPSLLVQSTLNDTCYTCHADKRGPFIWEHAPTRESCANCHTPHGSNQRSLLTSKDPFLCLACHSYGGHVNLPRYNRVSSSYGSGCVNCHITTHGSNHPSGAKFTR